MILKSIMIKKFIKQIPDCKEFFDGEILLNYRERKIQSKAHFLNSSEVKMNLTDVTDMDAQSEAFFDSLIRKGKDWDEIHFIRIVMLPKNIEIYIMGTKQGFQIAEKAPI